VRPVRRDGGVPFFDIPVQVKSHRYRDGFRASVEVKPSWHVCLLHAYGDGVAFASRHGAKQLSVAGTTYPAEIGGELWVAVQQVGYEHTFVTQGAVAGIVKVLARQAGGQAKRVEAVEQDHIGDVNLVREVLDRVGVHDLESF